ncbi:MAG TPA: molecular chaperone DnaJ [Anaerolineales bacterium]|nr:molecular chaperone DnaJ [Anaerolineales bacterium]
MPTQRDYYEILEVGREASAEDVRKAYRRLAKLYHPDVNKDPGAEERFKEINEAYAVLSDDSRRAAYDRHGHAGLQGVPLDFDFGFSDLFEEFFGFGTSRRRNRRAPHRGVDLRYDLQLEFREAVFGVEKQIELNRMEVCSVCAGSGAAPGSTPVRCRTCKGNGEVRQVRQTLLGSIVNVTTCPTCGGKGETLGSPCKQCDGRGLERRTVQRVVPIPAGVDEGTQIRLAGEGEPGSNGGPRGDLYIVVHVQPHRFYRRRDEEILVDLSINVAQAALGAKVEAPTLDGEEMISIPAGTQSGKVIRLKGKGVPRLRRSGRGDQLLIVTVETPRSLTAEQRELFEKLAATLDSHAKPQESGFLERLKELLGGLAD